jgi:DNA repair photolyase
MIRVRTTRAKSILSPASGYIGDHDFTLSPYVNCPHACAYCYVPTLVHHRRLAAIWGQEVTAKENAADLLERDARRGKVAGKRIYMSPNVDPYVPQERRFRITRGILEVFTRYPPGLLVIQTRSHLVLDDIELIERLREHVVVAISVTTHDERMRVLFERSCPPIARRVEALATLHAAGVRTQASVAPLLPSDPDRLARLLGPHVDWVSVQPFHARGPGARTWAPALAIIRERGWEGWLESGPDAHRAMARLRELFGLRYHEGRDGFGLPWLPTVGHQVTPHRSASSSV